MAGRLSRGCTERTTRLGEVCCPSYGSCVYWPAAWLGASEEVAQNGLHALTEYAVLAMELRLLACCVATTLYRDCTVGCYLPK